MNCELSIAQQVVHRVDPLFSAEEFGGHDGSQGQRAAVLDRVSDLQHVILRFVGHGVDARDGALAHGADVDPVGGRLSAAFDAVGGVLDSRSQDDPSLIAGEDLDD